MAERDCGIEVYLTATPGIGGRLKAEPEDFVVEEVGSPPAEAPDGKYVAALIRSRNWETNRLVREMSRDLRMSRRRIGFAGTKDKRSVATRWFSFEATPEEVGRLRLADVEVLESHRAAKPVEIGDLRGNRFHIVVRELAVSEDEAEVAAATTLLQLRAAGGFPNFFGMQRFGSIRPITHVVGRHIVRGDYQAAVDAYVANPIAGEDEGSFEAREALQDSGDYKAAFHEFPDSLGFEKAMLGHLAGRPGDFVGALKALPFNLLLLFVHAYQSSLFNRMVSERIRRGLPLNQPLAGDLLLPVGADGLVDRNRWVPVSEANLEKARVQCAAGKAFVSGTLIGTDSAISGGVMGEIEQSVLDAEGVRAHDFVVPRIPRLSSKGTRRELACLVGEISVEVSGDTAVLEFSLPRGAYATCLLREVLKDESGLG